ncbi:MAG: hypothetical protein K0R62_7033 [Nonomuraea muscovyensis]|nr:hypothetical protein [Nonomuraea muscovyensis]
MSTPAGGGLIGDATILVTADTTPAALALRGFTRDASGQLRDLRGRFVSESRLINNALNTATGGTSRFKDALDELKGAALLLSPALIPVAVQAAPIAASVGAAAVAIGAFAAAAAGQVTAISEAAEAEKKYKDAVDEHGATSQQAAVAQNAYVRKIEQMPSATRTAAAALSSLKDQYQAWSDSLASSTMPVATKALQAFSSVFPKLTPLVQGASGQLDRFVTILAGGLASPGLDALISRFSQFSTGALEKANDGLIRFFRTLNTGKINSGAGEFMEYVRANGPLVKDTLQSVMQALLHVAQAAANVGPGLLTLVNAFANLVAALPPSLITTMLQLALALKAVRIAAALAAATSGGMAAFAVAIGAMRTAAVGATGVMPRLAAAIGAMSRAAKLAVAGTGIGLLVIALTELSQRGRQAPPDVDKLTNSLAQLGKTGKVAGEASKAFGNDLDGLYGKVRSLTDPTTTDKVQQFLVGWTGWDSTPVKEATENLDSVDKALAGLVKNGRSDLAAAAVKRLTAEYGKGGRDTDQFTKELTEYEAALADVRFEQELAASAMGLFGQQAQQTSAKLAEQKASADGLRQAVQALNDAQRAGLGGMIGFEAAIDAAAAAARDNAGALSMSGGQLNLNSEKARNAASALQDLADKTDSAAGAARESGSSWETVNGIYTRGRSSLIASAQAMGLQRAEAERLADQILKIPDKTAVVKMTTEDATTDLNRFNAAVKSSPGTKKVTLQTLSKSAEQTLTAFGYKVVHLKDGSVAVTAKTGGALSGIRDVAGAIASLRDKTVRLTSIHNIITNSKTYRSVHDIVGRAAGGRVPGYAGGGGVQVAPSGLLRGPGSGTSDDILALFASGAVGAVSDSEYVVRAASVRKYGVGLFDDLNAGRLKVARVESGAPMQRASGGAVPRLTRRAAVPPSLEVGSTRPAQVVNVTYAPQIHFTNGGVLGSQFEVENWLIKALDTASRAGRLPRLLTAGV